MDEHDERARSEDAHTGSVPDKFGERLKEESFSGEDELPVFDESGWAELEPIETTLPLDSIFWPDRRKKDLSVENRLLAGGLSAETERSFEQWYRNGMIRELQLSGDAADRIAERTTGAVLGGSVDEVGAGEAASDTVVFSDGTFSLTDEAVIRASHAEDVRLLSLIESVDPRRSGTGDVSQKKDKNSGTRFGALRSGVSVAEVIRESFEAQYCLVFTVARSGIVPHGYAGDGEVTDSTEALSSEFLELMEKPGTVYIGDVPPERIDEFSFIMYPDRTRASWFLLRPSSSDRKVKILLSFSSSDSSRNEVIENMKKMTI